MRPFPADAFIDALKAKCSVTSDDELADRIGVAKSTIASWRRRQGIPQQVRDDLCQMFGIDYEEVIDGVVGSWLAESRPGDTILYLLSMRLSAKVEEGDFVEWSQWISTWREEILAEIARTTGRWDWGKESLADKLSNILLSVTNGTRFGGDYLINLRKAIDNRNENVRTFT